VLETQAQLRWLGRSQAANMPTGSLVGDAASQAMTTGPTAYFPWTSSMLRDETLEAIFEVE